MARIIDVPARLGLDDYESVAHLAPAVRTLREEAVRTARTLEGRTLWMVNSTEHGGGVAEMLPTVVTLLRELGVKTEWAVIESQEPRFFELTKRIHNLIHGAGSPDLTAEHRELFEGENARNAEEMAPWLSPGDILLVHDPQPMPLARILADRVDLRTVWRCHIGLDEENEATNTAWRFLMPYAAAYERGVFSAPEYVPGMFRKISTVITPAIDPLSHKNRDLPLHKIMGVLSNAALAAVSTPVLTPMYPWVAQRLQPTGRWAPANMSEDIGLPTRPIVSQISRWDRLKGWVPLLEAFAALKSRERVDGRHDGHEHRRRLELVRLALAGPEPESVADDPEATEVLEELVGRYEELPPHIQRDIALIALPLGDPAQNALMVNAIQRSSSLVVQNSLREGFGLTVTEAMWKHVPVLSNSRACGPRQQVRDGIDGRLVTDPSDVDALVEALDDMLRASAEREDWGRNAQRRVHRHFLVFNQVSAWLHLLEGLLHDR
ncbi:MAG: glycosyltransferase [Gemmatimonadota bacterium]|jgi:trehalose synthase